MESQQHLERLGEIAAEATELLDRHTLERLFPGLRQAEAEHRTGSTPAIPAKITETVDDYNYGIDGALEGPRVSFMPGLFLGNSVVKLPKNGGIRYTSSNAFIYPIQEMLSRLVWLVCVPYLIGTLMIVLFSTHEHGGAYQTTHHHQHNHFSQYGLQGWSNSSRNVTGDECSLGLNSTSCTCTINGTDTSRAHSSSSSHSVVSYVYSPYDDDGDDNDGGTGETECMGMSQACSVANPLLPNPSQPVPVSPTLLFLSPGTLFLLIGISCADPSVPWEYQVVLGQSYGVYGLFLLYFFALSVSTRNSCCRIGSLSALAKLTKGTRCKRPVRHHPAYPLTPKLDPCGFLRS
jgi:hypothetical protein